MLKDKKQYRMPMQFLRKTLLCALTLCLAAPYFPAQSARAQDEVTADTPLPNIVELQAQVEAASAVYDQATQRIIEIDTQIEELNDRIALLESGLPEARRLSNQAASDYYRMYSNSNFFLEVVLGATSVGDFFAKVEYATRVNQSYLNDIAQLSRLTKEVSTTREELTQHKQDALDEQRRAEEALAEAKFARSMAEETARKISEASAAATARAAEEAAAAEQNKPNESLHPEAEDDTGTGGNGGGSGGSGTGGSGSGNTDPGNPETPADKQEFVNLWAPRIDAYNAGSPLEGYGYAFASAAFDYNVDPRWSPAIACLESSKGRYCFRSHNAWGWGQIEWPDWESAIFDHVRGLSRGYGYTISIEAAQKYCPPNWEHWYNVVSQQMTLI